MKSLEQVAQRGELTRRIDAVRRGMAKRKLDALLVFDRHNTLYLSGFRGSLSYLFITARDAVLLVDGRYYEAMGQQLSVADPWPMATLEAIEVVRRAATPTPQLAERMAWRDRGLMQIMALKAKLDSEGKT